MNPYLVMELGGIPLYRQPICYDGMPTAGEKMHFQQRIAESMRKRYCREIRRSGKSPVFYVSGIESRGNGLYCGEIDADLRDEIPLESLPKLKRL